MISGIGDDDIALLPGVRVFAAATGAELATFPGPAGALFAGAARRYAAGPRGLEIWDPVTGHRTGTVPGAHPGPPPPRRRRAGPGRRRRAAPLAAARPGVAKS